MGKQKQQIISRFFAPKPKPSSPPSSPPPSQSSLPNLSTPPPKISATVTFSPLKRLRTSQLLSPVNKPPKTPLLSSNSDLPESSRTKLSPHTQNPIPHLSNPTLHEKFLNKLLEPSHEDRRNVSTSNTIVSVNPKYTPLEQQVVELKAKYKDVLLMVEVGYKFRFFGQDAENAARVLGIFAHMDHNFLTASIPTFRLNFHVRRLVSAGYKVGVVKQTETATIKAHGSNKLGPFCRGLSALYTKATLEASEDVGEGDEGCGSCNSYLVCVVEKKIDVAKGSGSGNDVKIGIVAVEISTGDVIYGEFDDNLLRTGIEAKILSLSPAELLIGDPLSKLTEKFLLAYAGPASNVRVERVSRDRYADGGALAEVLTSYDRMGDSHLNDNPQREYVELEEKTKRHLAIKAIMAMPDLAVQALALTIDHLKQFGFERILCLGASFRPFSNNVEMTLSANAIQQLEVLKNNSDGSESGSLLERMNHTLTISGSRLLRHWVSHPLRDRNMINARLDAISEILESMGSHNTCSDRGYERTKLHQLLTSVLTNLGRSPDIQRGITRIFHRTATALEFIAVIEAILLSGKQLRQLQVEEEDEGDRLQANSIHSPLLRKLILTASSSNIISRTSRLLAALNKEAAEQRDIPNLFVVSEGAFQEIATARNKVKQAKEKLDLLIGLYRKQLRNQKLEFTTVSGTTHLIELPQDVKVPSNWVKVNSTKKAIRYHAPEVLTALDDLSLANEELLLVCRSTWQNFLNEFGGYYSELQVAVQALAALDCLHSLALLARNKDYIRPVFVDDSEPVQICVSSGRHPVMETMLQDSFVPNDTSLHADGEYCQIVTGPNMGGKSCYIRQVALLAIMAQVGSFVPASSAKLHVLDGIYTRMGASDSIQQGRSTFLEELGEASHILESCTGQSLVILDELGRGTSTHDGVAIAYATLQYLLEQKRCMKGEPNGDYEDVVYLYKLVPGVSERSFGFKVAQLAQLPLSCINRASVMAMRLEDVVRKKKILQESGRNDEAGDMEGYKEMFSNLNLAAYSQDIDPAKSFECLKTARSLALELINRSMTEFMMAN
ncbi:DNA mismatch repair protein MSH3 isoform X2 [Cynara cardunculus var. scolymus]|uniref:DNA mismatch repair protein MSH3 isoform X2 n=1 Tax=Cynara cardunculus var. scolymus TaxID=59895 RepID=UPI000D627219|nr:DNA mismatch repair protein MSH3 isoform X2 [Cynara cardunculus var. scolymus]